MIFDKAWDNIKQKYKVVNARMIEGEGERAKCTRGKSGKIKAKPPERPNKIHIQSTAKSSEANGEA